jgi:hypothetical protein
MKQYNPNTKYGRKKLREQAAQNYANMSPEEREKHDSMGCLITMLIIAVVVFFILAAGGSASEITKWFTR